MDWDRLEKSAHVRSTNAGTTRRDTSGKRRSYEQRFHHHRPSHAASAPERHAAYDGDTGN